MSAPAFEHHGERMLYTVNAAADVLSMTRDYVYELIASGQLDSMKIGHLRRISREQLEDFVRRMSGGEGAG